MVNAAARWSESEDARAITLEGDGAHLVYPEADKKGLCLKRGRAVPTAQLADHRVGDDYIWTRGVFW